MRNHVQTINEDVESIERIEDDKASEFIADLEQKGFSREDIFICVRLNDVRFSTEVIEGLVAAEPQVEQAAAGE
jgi:hypothetical protein